MNDYPITEFVLEDKTNNMKKKFTMIMVLVIIAAGTTQAQPTFRHEDRRAEGRERYYRNGDRRLDGVELKRDFFYHKKCW
jgi:hypothetical protein